MFIKKYPGASPIYSSQKNRPPALDPAVDRPRPVPRARPVQRDRRPRARRRPRLTPAQAAVDWVTWEVSTGNHGFYHENHGSYHDNHVFLP